MATSSLRPYGYDAYVDAVTTDTFVINTNTTVYTAPAACSKVEWALHITQSAGLPQTNYATFSFAISDDVNALFAGDGGDGSYGLTNTRYMGYATTGSLVDVSGNNQGKAFRWPSIDPGQSLFVRWTKLTGSPGTMRWTLLTRVYQ
jgi:hypothetical protein